MADHPASDGTAILTVNDHLRTWRQASPETAQRQSPAKRSDESLGELSGVVHGRAHSPKVSSSGGTSPGEPRSLRYETVVGNGRALCTGSRRGMVCGTKRGTTEQPRQDDLRVLRGARPERSRSSSGLEPGASWRYSSASRSRTSLPPWARDSFDPWKWVRMGQIRRPAGPG
jgi:hypothetical protein